MKALNKGTAPKTQLYLTFLQSSTHIPRHLTLW